MEVILVYPFFILSEVLNVIFYLYHSKYGLISKKIPVISFIPRVGDIENFPHPILYHVYYALVFVQIYSYSMLSILCYTIEIIYLIINAFILSIYIILYILVANLVIIHRSLPVLIYFVKYIL